MSKSHQTDTETLEAAFPNGVVATFRRPSRPETMRFNDKIAGDKGSKHGAMEEYVLACAMTPDRDGARSLLEDYPSALASLCIALQQLAGSEIEISIKK
jgi:hypothetical protein